MKRITTAGLALVAMLAFGVFFAGTASAHSFLWTGATPSLVLAIGEGPQIFKPGTGEGVTCKSLKLDGKVTKASSESQVLVGEYTNCSAFGFASATVSPAEYEFNANETVSLLNTIVITVPLGGCSVKIDSIPANHNLAKIRYLKDPLNANALLAHAEVTKIDSISSGGSCGTAGLSQIGTYNGLALIFVHATGALSWE